ncbi:D-erythrose-4-phosphate dehydrogenase [BD1-7 clade bacterium]|uniref:D-erythrose-4-phosphate dehydrogenase n=1 Tax=BD1-7 clade bacterium TaxID=2029982 RepID=A0A5S9N3I3_9GAMM|nr:D-erythrose-4-phosphate dehydrogenase [BD1-7 clade bacterium]CAA0084294.1 D-erythrose-4-phosphate dehydrogenase [BD1-7 clade bacterium]
MYRLAINGYGRIGRSVLRALTEAQADGRFNDLQIVAINEPADRDTICHLTRFDSTHGRFAGDVAIDGEHLVVNGRQIQLSHATHVSDIDWPDVDLVLECSGSFADRLTAEQHLHAGARRVLFSQPGDPDVDLTVVYGVNHTAIEPDHRIISNASCTTNGSVPVLKLLHEAFGIDAASITTIHSAMNDQPVIDAYHHTDLRKTRSAFASMIPVDTGLARGIARFLPELEGVLSAQAVRVPTVNVSAMDICIATQSDVDVDSVNALLKDHAARLPGILDWNDEPLASIDFNHNPHSCIIDGTQTRVSGKRLLKLFVWFDNEWGYANRMLDVADYLRQQN